MKVEFDATTEPSQQSLEMLDALARLRDGGELQGAAGPQANSGLKPAMDYSLRLGGKQARGHLLLLVTAGWGVDWKAAKECAHAVELVHTASLIIDDLPTMDNALLRRGKPTNHLKFGVPTALLAAIAMLSEAFQIIASGRHLAADNRADAVAALAKAVGPEGMAGGQQMDIAPVGGRLEDIELVHAMKTGALFAAAAEIGSIVAGISGSRRWLMSDFGMLLGKAFQEFDDLIDKHGNHVAAGKDINQDADKLNVARILGREKAEARALEQVALALECLEASGIRQDDLKHYVLSLTQTLRGKLSSD